MKQIYILRSVNREGQDEWLENNMPATYVHGGSPLDFFQHIHTNGYIDYVASREHLNLWEISPYIFLARQYSWRPVIVTLIQSPERLSKTTSLPLAELTSRAHKLRRAAIPECWEVHEIVSYPSDSGWFRPVKEAEVDGQPKSQTAIDQIEIEMSRRAPRLGRIRDILNKLYTD